jgi:hypothetical protein
MSQVMERESGIAEKNVSKFDKLRRSEKIEMFDNMLNELHERGAIFEPFVQRYKMDFRRITLYSSHEV